MPPFPSPPLPNCHTRPLHTYSSVPQEKLTFGPRNSYTVEGLKPNTEYSFSLAAISNKGIGAFTNELVQRTSQASMSTTRLMAFEPFYSRRYLAPPAARGRLAQAPHALQPSLHRSIYLLYQLFPLSSILTVPFLLHSAAAFLTQPQQRDGWRRRAD